MAVTEPLADEQEIELSILIPCLNEASTIRTCIDKAEAYLATSGVRGEVIVVDNGSTDGSVELVRASGARLVNSDRRGYGRALRTGLQAARGRFVIMGDGDDSYDFSALQPFVEELRRGTDLVIGNRFLGGIEKGAMPPLNRFVGNPLLSFLGRRLFDVPIGDFHCGLRGANRAALSKVELNTTGMEFASEMIVRSKLAGLEISEVPTTLGKDGREGRSHLRALPDGFRHLLFLLLYCPRWLFFVPGFVLIALGLAAGIPTALEPVRFGTVTFDVDTLAIAAATLIIGLQAVQFGLLADVYGSRVRLFREGPSAKRLLALLSIRRVVALAALLICAGIAGVIASTLEWQHASFGVLDTRHEIRIIISSITALIVGFQLVLGRLFMGLIGAEFADDLPT